MTLKETKDRGNRQKTHGPSRTKQRAVGGCMATCPWNNSICGERRMWRSNSKLPRGLQIQVFLQETGDGPPGHQVYEGKRAPTASPTTSAIHRHRRPPGHALSPGRCGTAHVLGQSRWQHDSRHAGAEGDKFPHSQRTGKRSATNLPRRLCRRRAGLTDNFSEIVLKQFHTDLPRRFLPALLPAFWPGSASSSLWLRTNQRGKDCRRPDRYPVLGEMDGLRGRRDAGGRG